MSESRLLIRGGTVIDGTGGPGFRSDVRVRDGRITEVGPDLVPDGESEIDATGAVVTPGFIDSHAHTDPQVFWDPSLDPEPLHGVTTMLVGNCSLSLFPVTEASQGRRVGPVRVHRGRAPPPVRRQRPLELVQLRRLSRHGERNRNRDQSGQPGRAQPAAARGDGRGRLDPRGHGAGAVGDGRAVPGRHGRRCVGPFDLSVRCRQERSSRPVACGRHRRARRAARRHCRRRAGDWSSSSPTSWEATRCRPSAIWPADAASATSR